MAKFIKSFDDKLELLLQIENSDVSNLTNKARVWSIQSLKPTLHCFRAHFNSNRADFSFALIGKL
jgi:hypothetical protein